MYYSETIKMPRMKPDGTRDYSYDSHYEASSAQRKNRSERVLARRELAKEGLVHKGDGKDVDHVKPLSKGGSNSRSNLRAISAHANRSKGNRS
jgi:5-methylcytosine-specific restriction endonuclease McrA